MSKRNTTKSNLDEMQEQKLLRLEHNGFWIAFWGLLAAIIAQWIFFEIRNTLTLVGELLVFFVMSVYLMVGCVKNGIWDRKLKPNPRTNMVGSVIGGVTFGTALGIRTYLNTLKLGTSILIGFCAALLLFVLCFGALTLTTWLYKKRLTKLESDCET